MGDRRRRWSARDRSTAPGRGRGRAARQGALDCRNQQRRGPRRTVRRWTSGTTSGGRAWLFFRKTGQVVSGRKIGRASCREREERSGGEGACEEKRGEL